MDLLTAGTIVTVFLILDNIVCNLCDTLKVKYTSEGSTMNDEQTDKLSNTSSEE